MKKFKFFAAIMATALFVAFLCSCTGKNGTETTTSSDVEMETIWSKPDRFEMPTEALTEIGTDGKQAMLSAIEEARTVYSLFVSAKPALDMNDTKEGADGIVYYRVADERLNTSEKFKNYLLRYFSKEIVSNLLNIQMYVEDENGNMYAVDVGMSDNNVVSYSITDYEESETRMTATVSVVRDFDTDGKEDKTEELTFIREPVGNDGSWVFTRFSFF